MKDSRSNYTRRIDRVTDYIRDHLYESPSLDELAAVAYLSPFHFHRIFTAITGETVNSCTNRMRLEKAARLLKYSKKTATEIAFECGFSSSSTFSRSFQKHFETSPTKYRKRTDLKNSKIRKDLFPVNEYLLPMSDAKLKSSFPVEIKEFPERRVAFIRVIDAYRENSVADAFGLIVKWAKRKCLFQSETIFGMSIDDPMVTPKEKYRYEACITIPESLKLGHDEGLSEMTIPASKYAVAQVSGDIKIVATATEYLFNKWLFASNFEPEHLPALEVFLDKENISNWDHFELDLCIPIKPLGKF